MKCNKVEIEEKITFLRTYATIFGMELQVVWDKLGEIERKTENKKLLDQIRNALIHRNFSLAIAFVKMLRPIDKNIEHTYKLDKEDIIKEIKYAMVNYVKMKKYEFEIKECLEG